MNGKVRHSCNNKTRLEDQEFSVKSDYIENLRGERKAEKAQTMNLKRYYHETTK